MPWTGYLVFWGEVVIVLVLCYVAYKAIFRRAGIQELTLDDLKKLF